MYKPGARKRRTGVQPQREEEGYKPGARKGDPNGSRKGDKAKRKTPTARVCAKIHQNDDESAFGGFFALPA